ncbi:MAG: Zn-dependent oligopeptidase, partial [Acinetobacter guillouiae]
MKMKRFKLTTLCMLSMGMGQWAFAETERSTLPKFQAKDIPAQCDAKIADVKTKLAEFAKVKLKNNAPAGAVLAKWDQIFAEFEDFYGPINLASNVDPSADLRKAAEDCEVKISQFQTEVYQDGKLYQQIKKTKASDEIDRKYRQDILDGFEDTGVQLPAEKQARLKVILDELTKIQQEYVRNIRDNPDKLEFTPAELKGLPESYIANLKKNEKGNYLLGFDYPEYRPFMELADSDDARKRYQIAYTRRGTE